MYLYVHVHCTCIFNLASLLLKTPKTFFYLCVDKFLNILIFKQVLKPMMLRRLKEDVEKSLAPKEETIIEVRS